MSGGTVRVGSYPHRVEFKPELDSREEAFEDRLLDGEQFDQPDVVDPAIRRLDPFDLIVEGDEIGDFGGSASVFDIDADNVDLAGIGHQGDPEVMGVGDRALQLRWPERFPARPLVHW